MSNEQKKRNRKELNLKAMHESNYSKVLKPKKMKSMVWKYFGYPGNMYNEIITKDLVICTICYSKFRNNYNTTNLRTHLERNHSHLPDIDVPSTTLPKTFSSTDSGKKKTKLSEGKDKVFVYDEVEEQYDTIFVNVNDIEHQVIDESIVVDDTVKEIVENSSMEISDVKTDLGDNQKELPEVKVKVSYDVTGVCSSDVQEKLCEMIIEDIQPTDMVGYHGFQSFIKALTKGGVNIPSKESIEEHIVKLYELKSKRILNSLKSHSHNKPFALSFENWENISGQQYITFYFYFVKDDFELKVKNFQITTIKLSQFTNFNEIFDGYNLKNCTAVVGTTNPILEEFFSRYDIPILPCLECTIKNCLKNAFNLFSISSIYTEIQEYLEEVLQTQEYFIPNLNRDSPWTKFDVLHIFCENISWPDDSTNRLLQKAKDIFECLSHLKLSIDSLAEEENAISSISRPLSNNLIENNFQQTKLDTSNVCELKEAITAELTKSITSNDYLAVTSFMDPRFFRYLSEDNTAVVEDFILCVGKKHNVQIENEVQTDLNNDSKNNRKSGLKFLFNRSKDISCNDKIENKSGLKEDLQKYKAGAFADLDECPLKWWSRYGHMQGNLRKLADMYNCIPACCNNRYLLDIEVRTSLEDKRANLTGNCIVEILFLNYNR